MQQSQISLKQLMLVLASWLYCSFAFSGNPPTKTTTSTSTVKVPPRYQLYQPSSVGKQPIPYENVREADVFWQKRVWRLLDFREKMNLPFTYPDTSMRLFDIIHNAAKTGQVMVFSPLDDEFTSPLSLQEVNELGGGKDSFIVTDPITGKDSLVIQDHALNPEDVIKLRIKEDWYFDNRLGKMQVRIIGVAPVIEKYSSNGTLLGLQTLYWVYFQDLRPLLEQHTVANFKQDANRLNWEELLEMRMFSSTIYKVSNVQDRSISSNYNGIDALLKAEEEKEKIINMEQDQWSY